MSPSMSTWSKCISFVLKRLAASDVILIAWFTFPLLGYDVSNHPDGYFSPILSYTHWAHLQTPHRRSCYCKYLITHLSQQRQISVVAATLRSHDFWSYSSIQTVHNQSLFHISSLFHVYKPLYLMYMSVFQIWSYSIYKTLSMVTNHSDMSFHLHFWSCGFFAFVQKRDSILVPLMLRLFLFFLHASNPSLFK